MQIDQALTDKMVDEAIRDCAGQYFDGDERRMRQALVQGQCQYCHCLSRSLVRLIGEYLGQVDRHIKSIYHYESVAAQGDTAPSFSQPFEGLNLVVWVERKSAALGALLQTFETALRLSLGRIGCADFTPGCFVLDVKLVSDQEVYERRGLGMLVGEVHLRSSPVWQRPALQGPLPAENADEAAQLRQLLPETFDPELIPESRLLEHALSIERIPHAERGLLEHHLTELKVVLIRRLISDQLEYIRIARRWFDVQDLADIHRRKIGMGRIGGKAAGMLLAARILTQLGDDSLRSSFRVPESFFLGSDVMYIFMAMNGLIYWNDQKYKPEQQIWQEYPQIKHEFLGGKFPPEILAELRDLLSTIGDRPLIVRSSSQLEDNFGTAFAGKYDSHFCPNQGTPEENLQALTAAIAGTYASTLKPEALLYRRSKGLQDYDERMAILIQVVQGEQYGQYYLPQGAGVAFSRNLYRWAPQIRREDGFARLVWGLGTRAVERVGNDYPHPVALSHPTLQPDDSPEIIRYYSQHFVDLIDLQANEFKVLPVQQVIRPDYPGLRFIAQLERDGYLVTPRSRVMSDEIPNLVITFDELLRRTNFPATLTTMLRLLEENYHSAVDLEFTLHVPDPYASPAHASICLLQCRPLSYLQESHRAHLPEELPEQDTIFSTRFMVPQGYLPGIRYVLFVPPEAYFALETVQARKELGQVISRLNSALPAKAFICVGPGRWGSLNTDLGVYVCYSDIDHTGALVEISGQGIGAAPEPSLGTHFFQDLMEAQIYPLAVNLDDPESFFRGEFFYDTPNRLSEWLPSVENLPRAVRLIEVADYRPGFHLEIVMDDEAGQAVAYLAPDAL